MSKSGFSITLTNAQVAELVRDASAQQMAGDMAAAFDTGTELLDAARRVMHDERYSCLLARAMMVFAAFPSDGQSRSVTDVAEQLCMSSSMVHRYIATFAELGLLERDTVSRRYRRRLPADRT